MWERGKADHQAGRGPDEVSCVLAAAAAAGDRSTGAGRARRLADGSALVLSEAADGTPSIEIAGGTGAGDAEARDAIVEMLAHELQAVVVTCKADGRPNPVGASTASVQRHALDGGRIGFVPGSIGLAVVEIAGEAPRTAERDAVAAAGTPLARSTTPGGDTLLYYRQAEEGGDATRYWRHGRILHHDVPVALWDPAGLVEAVAARSRAPDAPLDRLDNERRR